MNQLPAAFYDALFPHLFMKTVRNAQGLPGIFGRLARVTIENRHDHAYIVENNAITTERLYNWDRDVEEDPKPVEKKYTNSVVLWFLDGNHKTVDDSIPTRIRNKYAEYMLRLETQTVSKAWIKWICSWQFTGLEIYEQLGESTTLVCKDLLKRGRISQMLVKSAAYTERIMDWMKMFLLQDQFETLYIEDCQCLTELLTFWSKNAEKLERKNLNLFGTCGEAAKALDSELERCSKAESEEIKRDRFFFYNAMFDSPSKGYKLKKRANEGPSDHNVYVFFECKGKSAKSAELAYLKRTNSLRIFFA
ncbi:hypothetical protein QR680_006710 [Steinernema hermaphroditum]|uniref:Uncharacterized protein n=1 Tax=Steinernema hermaphroditum TaxID=289476 RepID=A0AA39LXJ4_9BILA|nr:hypothetical protein QR680_006710 [Steinernema hermaphroditum]